MADTYRVIQPNANGPKGPFFLGEEIELDSVPGYLIGKVELVSGGESRELEVATPESVPETGSDHEAELRDFIYEKTGKHAGGRSTIKTLERQAKKLGWVK